MWPYSNCTAALNRSRSRMRPLHWVKRTPVLNQRRQINEVMMKAIVVSKYGGPEVMQYEDFPDPSPSPDEVLVRVAATSINPFDIMRRSGAAKAFAPISFPGVVGVDVAGTVISCGKNAKGFSAGDRVFGMASQTYAELCVVKADSLAK